jgi:hypothetical protein
MTPKKLDQQLSVAQKLWTGLQDTEARVLSNYQNALRQRVLAVASVNKLRPQVLELIGRLGAIMDENVREQTEALANSPLFHPAFEEIQQSMQEYESEEVFYEHQLDLLRDEMEDYYDHPYPEELKALQYLLLKAKDKSSEEVRQAFAQDNIPRLFALSDGAHLTDKDYKIVSSGLSAQIERLKDTTQLLEDLTGAHTEEEEDEYTMELEGLMEFMSRLKKALEDSVEQQQVSSSLQALIAELDEMEGAPEGQELFDWFEGMMEEDDATMDDLFADFFQPEENDWEEIESPEYSRGSVVAIKAKDWLDHTYESSPFTEHFKSPSDPRAYVVNAYSDGKNVYYEILLDATTLKALSVEYIRFMCHEMEDSFAFMVINAEEITASTPRDSEEDSLLAYKELFNRYFWGDIEKESEAKLIYEVLMKNPEESDLHNWYQFFANTLEMPFQARVDGVLDWELDEGTTVEVLAVGNINESEEADNHGIKVFVKTGSETLYYPLLDLLPADEKGPNGKALMAYRWWSDLLM